MRRIIYNFLKYNLVSKINGNSIKNIIENDHLVNNEKILQMNEKENLICLNLLPLALRINIEIYHINTKIVIFITLLK